MEYKHLEKVMMDYGQALADDLQNTVPIKTGALKKSIRFKGLKRNPDGFEVDIEALYYFTYLDKGTKFIVPREYLKKSRERIGQRFAPMITDATGKDIKISLIKEIKR